MLLECQYICCLIIVSFILRELNKEALSYKHNLMLVRYYSYELFSLCGLINNIFNDILMRILVTFMTTVSSGCWLVFYITENDYSYAIVGLSIFWIFTNNLGICVILFFCCSVRNEVSRTINKV